MGSTAFDNVRQKSRPASKTRVLIFLPSNILFNFNLPKMEYDPTRPSSPDTAPAAI